MLKNNIAASGSLNGFITLASSDNSTSSAERPLCDAIQTIHSVSEDMLSVHSSQSQHPPIINTSPSLNLNELSNPDVLQALKDFVLREIESSENSQGNTLLPNTTPLYNLENHTIEKVFDDVKQKYDYVYQFSDGFFYKKIINVTETYDNNSKPVKNLELIFNIPSALETNKLQDILARLSFNTDLNITKNHPELINNTFPLVCTSTITTPCSAAPDGTLSRNETELKFTLFPLEINKNKLTTPEALKLMRDYKHELSYQMKHHMLSRQVNQQYLHLLNTFVRGEDGFPFSFTDIFNNPISPEDVFNPVRLEHHVNEWIKKFTRKQPEPLE